MKEILQKAKAIEAQIIADRRALHQMPEVGLDLPQTAAYIKKRLSEMGIPHQDCGGVVDEATRQRWLSMGYPKMEATTGVVATIGSGGPCILLRADMDALPMEEINDLSFRATGSSSHMCGHDTHVAMLLGAAQVLKEMEGQLGGTVKLMFQPGEELGAGAKAMVADGLLENPKVDAAMAIHIMSQTPLGKITCAPKLSSSSLDSFTIRIQGRGGHSSAPNDCIDPLMILNQVYTAVNLLVTREVSPKATATLTCGVIQGGTAVNIIPDTAEMKLGLRTLDKTARDTLLRRIPQMIDHYIKAWGGEYELITGGTPSTICDPAFLETVAPFVTEVVGEGNLEVTEPMAGTEDFSYVSAEVPAALFMLGGGGEGAYPHHNPHMVLDESAFATGAAVYANCAFEWLRNQGK